MFFGIGMATYTIKELPADVRPRERLVRYGAEALSTTELLALVIRTGYRGRNALDLSNELLKKYEGDLKSLFTATVGELSEVGGVKTAKAAQIKACFELAKRLSTFAGNSRHAVASPEDAVVNYGSEMRYLDKECLKCIYLNAKNVVLKAETVSVGGLNSASITPREVFKGAISNSASSIILLHNHPSGDPKPSSADVEITERILDAGKILGIKVLDHIVLGDGKFVSLKREGLMP